MAFCRECNNEQDLNRTVYISFIFCQNFIFLFQFAEICGIFSYG